MLIRKSYCRATGDVEELPTNPQPLWPELLLESEDETGNGEVE
jgi:hypothetical protein